MTIKQLEKTVAKFYVYRQTREVKKTKKQNKTVFRLGRPPPMPKFQPKVDPGFESGLSD